MRKTFLLALAAVCVLTFALSGIATAADSPQMYEKEKSITWDRKDVGKDGKGVLAGQYPFNRNTAPKDFIIREIGWMTLAPGDSIGMHKHEVNEDAYIILSGEGVFVDTAGKETKVKAGDTTIARIGQSHALLNTGKVPLVFLDIVAER